MAWRKPDPALVERFGALVPNVGTVERRTMFGCPCAFVGGNMFAGVHEDRLILRLGEKRREQLLAKGKVAPFAPGGRTMREYVAVETAATRTQKELGAFALEAFEFASSLPAKVKRTARVARAPVRNSARRSAR